MDIIISKDIFIYRIYSYGLCGLKHDIDELDGDVSDAQRTTTTNRTRRDGEMPIEIHNRMFFPLLK